MNIELLTAGIRKVWDGSIVEQLSTYIRIPNKSPLFDPQWERNGHMEAANHSHGRVVPRPAAGREGCGVQVRRLPGRTPLALY